MTKRKKVVKVIKKNKPRIKAPPHIEIKLGCIQDYGVYFIVSRDQKHITKWLNSWLSKDVREEDFASANGICFRYDGNWPVICMPQFPTTPRQIGTLTHEVFHAIY